MNLLFQMQDSRHALERFVNGDTEGQQYPSLQDTEGDDDMDTHLDCKETPGSGCESAERLRVIHEGKQILEDAGEGNNNRRRWDSLDWYKSCSEGGDCVHLDGNGGSISTLPLGDNSRMDSSSCAGIESYCWRGIYADGRGGAQISAHHYWSGNV